MDKVLDFKQQFIYILTNRVIPVAISIIKIYYVYDYKF